MTTWMHPCGRMAWLRRRLSATGLLASLILCGALAAPGGAGGDPTFRLSASPVELATDKTVFLPFAQQVSEAVDRLLAEPVDGDTARLKTLLAIQVHLAIFLGNSPKALEAGERIRSLQTTPADRAYTGLMTQVLVAARAQAGAPGSGAFTQAFQKGLRASLAELPSTPAMRSRLELERRQTAALTDASLLEDVRGIPSGAAGKPGYCTLEEAGRIVRAWQKRSDIMPLKAAILAELDAAIAARSEPARTAAEPTDQTCDLVVVEATPAGIAMAVRTAREGGRVILVNHNAHLGGMLSSGLGVWDTRWEGKRSPIYDQVRQEIFDYYRTTYGANSPQYRQALPGKSGHTNGKFEAHVAEKILTDLVAAERNITVLRGYSPVAVDRQGARLDSITFRRTEGTDTIRIVAKIFADCTYEGDVLPLAQVPYRVGREARAEFGEEHAGVIYLHPTSEAPTAEEGRASAILASLHLRRFPGYNQILPGSTGAGDNDVQAFNYRTMICSDPDNRIPVSRPSDYDPAFLRRLEPNSVVEPVPNQKASWNRPQLIGPHDAYVEGDPATRRKVMDENWRATLALLWFLQHDASVPPERQRYWQKFGLAKDEFADHGNRPYELYVREARRLVGRYIFTEHDGELTPELRRAPAHPDSIAITEWYFDAHSAETSHVRGSMDEGKMTLGETTLPGELPYAALLPRGLDNLLVPGCLSATHVGWGTIRLEPTWMNLAESAGFAAAQALRHDQTPAEIDTDELVRTLAKQRVMVSFFDDADVASGSDAVQAAEYFGTKGFFPDYHAKLAEPLSRGLATAWANGFRHLRAGDLDPAALLASVSKSVDDGPVSGAEFAALVSPGASAPQAALLSRGEALTLMWATLSPLTK